MRNGQSTESIELTLDDVLALTESLYIQRRLLRQDLDDLAKGSPQSRPGAEQTMALNMQAHHHKLIEAIEERKKWLDQLFTDRPRNGWDN